MQRTLTPNAAMPNLTQKTKKIKDYLVNWTKAVTFDYFLSNYSIDYLFD